MGGVAVGRATTERTAVGPTTGRTTIGHATVDGATTKRTILHVDINSYFATLLQQENPRLRGRPIGIIKDVGRSCVIAASKEAKQHGVRTGSSLVEARRRCPGLMAVPASFDRYLDATKRLQRIFLAIAPPPNVYIFSLDEAFIDITTCRRYLYRRPRWAAERLQADIKVELGEWVTCNVGISHNRLLAKIASEISPKGSVAEISHANLDAVLASITFSDVCGVGYRLEKKLAKLGVSRPYQLRFYSVAELEPVVGPFWARELRRIAYGREPHVLRLIDRPQPHMKSVGRSITGYRLYDDEAEIRAILLNLMEEVTAKVRRMGLAGRLAFIRLYGHDDSWGAHRTLRYHLQRTDQLFEVLYRQLYQSWPRRFQIIKFWVGLGLLQPVSTVTPSLLPQDGQRQAVATAVDTISRRYGLFTVRSGALLNQPIIRPEVTGYLGDRQYQLEHV